MELYHATNNDNIIKFDINHSAVGNDFGRGLYLTDDIESAKKWALKKNKDLKGKNVIYVSDVDISSFNICFFDEEKDFSYIYYNCINDSEEALMFVFNDYCKIDIICGPIIKNYDFYSYLMNVFHGFDVTQKEYEKFNEKIKFKINTIEELDSKIKYINSKKTIQFCFKTDNAIDAFNYGIKKMIIIDEYKKIISEQHLFFDTKENIIKRSFFNESKI